MRRPSRAIRPTRPIPAEVCDELMRLVWARFNNGRLCGVLAPYFVGGIEGAARALATWTRLPMKPTQALPATLPGEAAWPASTTPWGRLDSPLPGVDLDPAAVEALAWDALWDEVRGVGLASEANGQVLAALANDELARRTAVLLVSRWVRSGHALACLRALHDPRDLSIRDAVVLRRRVALKQVREAWTLLVEHGMDPQEAHARVLVWNPRDRVLPDGKEAPDIEPPEDAQAPAARVAAALNLLLLELPLHWEVLARTDLRQDRAHPTMAVGITERRKRPTLFYNPDFVMKLTVEETAGVLVHEVHHLLFGHLTRIPDDAEEHPRAWILACEVTCNEHIRFPLPGQPYTIELLQLPPGESTKRRYERLKTRKLPKDVCGCGPPILRASLAEDPMSAGHTADRPAERPEQVLVAAARAVGEGLDPATRTMLRRCGDLPGDATEAVQVRDATVPWNRVLRRMCQRLGRPATTRRWPSRRAPGAVGILPGRRRRPEPATVLAVVDTSASVTTEELSAIAGELEHLRRRQIRVALAHCDTRLTELGWLRSPDQVQTFHGRGGTDMRPAFAPEVLQRWKPKLIVYFTDGHGPAPERPPPGVEVLWALTGPDAVRPAPWGRVVEVRVGT